MLKAKVFLICLSVMLLLFSAIAAFEMYAMERAIARSIYADVFDDMQDIGYLEPLLADYYLGKMQDLGWDVASDVFAGSNPRAEGLRARKERNEMVTLSLEVRPSRLSQWMHLFAKGETSFRFTGSRPSEYFDPGW
ncbi:hypothetical protein KDJ56_01005 [Brevibacillus composti]|uniref:Uncharacterized protein n=1 Tax=Brevibacillus composti TaxID=2796470 RepID=A0A7T5EL60_9BACL|nr:hypothetical protein [Brevibacillus composti]QQE74618.1 hypothetical protein JD108_01005 [Brevibacillus composti]QUO41701.1 hypothetical protein KDJ56_01005 [Brevibacillus composti]